MAAESEKLNLDNIIQRLLECKFETSSVFTVSEEVVNLVVQSCVLRPDDISFEILNSRSSRALTIVRSIKC
jgi:hypothetical protein